MPSRGAKIVPTATERVPKRSPNQAMGCQGFWRHLGDLVSIVTSGRSPTPSDAGRWGRLLYIKELAESGWGGPGIERPVYI